MRPARTEAAGRRASFRAPERAIRPPSHRASQLRGPYGQDRIVPIFLATLAVRQKSQTIRFKTAAEMLETFGMHKGGKEYRRLVAAFERIFGATIFFGTEKLTSTAKVVQRSRFNFLREARIWYHPRDEDAIPDEFANVIVLSDEFYQEITT